MDKYREIIRDYSKEAEKILCEKCGVQFPSGKDLVDLNKLAGSPIHSTELRYLSLYTDDECEIDLSDALCCVDIIGKLKKACV